MKTPCRVEVTYRFICEAVGCSQVVETTESYAAALEIAWPSVPAGWRPVGWWLFCPAHAIDYQMTVDGVVFDTQEYGPRGKPPLDPAS